MSVTLDPNNSNLRPGLTSSQRTASTHTSRTDQTAHISSMESLSNRRDCDDGCAQSACADVINSIFSGVVFVVSLPFVLIGRFCTWVYYQGILPLLYPEPTNVPPDLLNLEQDVIDIGRNYQMQQVTAIHVELKRPFVSFDISQTVLILLIIVFESGLKGIRKISFYDIFNGVSLIRVSSMRSITLVKL